MDTPQTPPDQPDRPGDEPETEPQPAAETPPPPRRLTRSRSDRVVAGVAGGLGRHLNIDPVIVRIAFVVAVLAGGAGLVAYLAAVLLVPDEQAAGLAPAPGTTAASPDRTLTVVGVVVLLFFTWPILLGGGLLLAGLALPLAILGGLGLLAWRVVSGKPFGDDPGQLAGHALVGSAILLVCLMVFVGGGWAAAVGGGTIAAGIVIGAGVVLLVGAFAGGARWILLPAIALAMGVGLVSAAGIELDGGIGEREYRPAAAAELRDRYELGMGELVVDLRDVKLPAGDTRVKMQIGMGEARLIVPRDVCVATTADMGAGLIEVFDHEHDGADVSLSDERRAPSGTSRVVVDADVGLGHFAVSHDDVSSHHGHGHRFGGDDDSDSDSDRSGNDACATETAAAGAGRG